MTDDKAIIPIEHKTAGGETHLLLYSEGNEASILQQIIVDMESELLPPVDALKIALKILRGMVRK